MISQMFSQYIRTNSPSEPTADVSAVLLLCSVDRVLVSSHISTTTESALTSRKRAREAARQTRMWRSLRRFLRHLSRGLGLSEMTWKKGRRKVLEYRCGVGCEEELEYQGGFRDTTSISSQSEDYIKEIHGILHDWEALTLNNEQTASTTAIFRRPENNQPWAQHPKSVSSLLPSMR